MPRPTHTLRAERLEDRTAPVADLYTGVPLTTAIPAHPDYPETGAVGFVSPDGNNPDGATAGTNGAATNPYTLAEGVAWANATGVTGRTLILRGGQYRAASHSLLRAGTTVQAYRQEQPWLNGAVVVSNWTPTTVDLGGSVGSRTYWRMGTDDFDHDGTAATAVRDFEFPQNRDFHYVDVARNAHANNGEQVFVTDPGGLPTPVKQVGLYRKVLDEAFTVSVGGTPTAVVYNLRRTSDNKLLHPDGVPAADAAGTAIDGGGTTPADYAAAVAVPANLQLLLTAGNAVDPDEFFVDYVNRHLYVGADPAATGRTLEVTTAGRALTVNVADVTVRGLGFKNFAREGLSGQDGAVRLRLEDTALTWNGEAGYGLTGDDGVVRNSRLVANGRKGAGSSRADRLLAEGNEFSFNNVERYTTFWDAAAYKVTEAEDMVFRDNIFRDNFATSLWMDINVVRATVVNNTAVYTPGYSSGLAYFVEISDSNTVAFNLAVNAANGIQISGASRTRVYNNTFVNCSTPVLVKDYDRVNDVNEDGGAVGGGGAFEGDPYEGGEDDRFAALGSGWETHDNELVNNLLVDTRGSTLLDASGTEEGSPLVNSRVTGRPYHSRTMLQALDFNGYHTAAATDRFVAWDPGTAADVVYDTVAQFEQFKSLYGLEAHTPTSGPGRLVFEGTADPFLVNWPAGDYRPKADGPAVNRSVAAGTIAAVPADILRAAGRAQPTHLGAIPPAAADTVPPTVSAVAAQTVAENTGTTTVAFTVGDAVTPAGTVLVSATSSNLVLLPLANMTVGGSGAGRTVALTPAANQAGTAVVTLTAADAAGNRTVTTFLLTVSVANVRPTIAGGSTSRFSPTVGAKDTPLSVPLTLADSGGDVNAVTLSAVSWGEEFVPTANLQFTGSGAARTLTVTPRPGTTGIVSVTVTATDALGGTTSRRLFLDFRAADGNRSPRIHAILNRGVPVGTSTGQIAFITNDLEQPTGAGLTITATSSDPLLVPAGSLTLGGDADTDPSSRWVQVVPAAGRSGVAVITLTVRDRGANGVAGDADDATGTRQFTVFVNSPPTGVSLSAASIPENRPAGAAVGTLTASDPGPAGDSFTFALVPGTGSADNARFAVSGSQLVLAGPLDFEAQRSYAVRVRATDALGAAVEQQLTVTATDVNEAPVISSFGGGATATVDVAEGGTAVGRVTATDPDAGAAVTFVLAGGADQGKFAIDAATGALRFLQPPAFLAPTDADGNGVYEVVVRASDGTLSDTQAVSVRVRQVVTATTVANGGQAQRSRLTSLSVRFNAAVTLQPGAFTLFRPADGAAVTDGGAGPQVVATTSTAGGQTTATLTFRSRAGSDLVEWGSLADGAWVLRVDRTKVTATTGTMPADHTTPADGSGRLHRLFGDVTGDATVNADDLTIFASAFGLSAGDSGFDPALDFEADGAVNADDLSALASRFGATV